MATFADYSTTAANNNSASPNGAPEGMGPDTVNNIMREMMARMRSNYADVDAYATAGGSANALTMAPGNIDAYAAGQTFRFKAASDNTGATTLNVNALGAKNIYKDGAALIGGELVTDRIYCVTYDGTQFALNDSSYAITQGRHTIFWPAFAMYARTTSGAAPGSVESTTNKVVSKSLDFDADAIEYAQFMIRMPKSWNEGTVTAQFVWTASGGSGDVIFGLQAVALSNDDALDTAFGTAQTATDTLIATSDIHISPETSAITIAGTPAAEDVVVFQTYRNATAGGDTHTADARLLGVTIYVTLTASTDA